MDPCDRARHYQDKLNAEAANKRRPEPRLPYTGRCHNCEAPVASPQRFCDAWCSDEWEEIQQRRIG